MVAVFGETLSFEQENGPDVELVVSGDEYYARYETKDGYAVVYDNNLGLYCYALVIDGRFVSSGAPITEAPPPEVQRHAQESEEVRHAKVAEKLVTRTPPPE